MKNKVIILTLLFGSFWFSACENVEKVDQISNETTDLISTEDVSSIVNIIELYNTDDVEEATSNETKNTMDKGKCFEVIFYPNENGENWPKSWTIDFGDGTCIKPNGIVRSGKIHITLTDCWRNVGSLRTITFEDFYINYNHLEGTKTIENIGLNEDGYPTWEWKVMDGKITDTTGIVTTWNSTRYSVMIEGADTWEFYDDIYEVSGGGSGTYDNIPFTVEITSPLVYQYECRFPVSGIIQITINDTDVIIIDFGDGECDNIATKQIGDTIEEITLCKNQ